MELLGMNGRKAVENYYNWGSVCDRAVKLFRSSLE
jgi:hypothetical protein